MQQLTLTSSLGYLLREENLWRPREKFEPLLDELILRMHRYYYEKSAVYRRICEIEGVSERAKTDDLFKVMLIDKVFKSYPTEYPEKEPEKFLTWLNKIVTKPIKVKIEPQKSLQSFLDKLSGYIWLSYSSGTTGRFSFIPRDEKTVEYCIKSYSEAAVAISGDYVRKMHFILALPRKTHLFISWIPKEVAERISGKVTVLLNQVSADIVRARTKPPTCFSEKIKASLIGVLGNIMKSQLIKKLYREVKKAVEKGEEVIVFGSMPVMYAFCKKLIERGERLELPGRSIIVTGGGFKLEKGVSLEDFRRMLNEALGVPAPERHVDGYGMCECNTLFYSCVDGGEKHVPPWIKPVLLDEELNPLPEYGRQTGRFAFFDPLAQSYPGFIITGDKVTINWNGCSKCSREGPVIESIERVKSEEGRGCALVLSRVLGE